ncbi:hypothetical protein A3K86_18440 [Photobacterium jeanii]|uniref:Uncharacterized protein n=1 Tax=Photobacterium jeanii TaxID=858640 RepID=A0A178K2J6_9GAMM|nr:hypothetical protein [Photobacterium jeanii]OAN10963.1 hypothetical protein A3K86_18440 [Photobacterium jeanii]PST90478.1 hypothetical protein C9I91_07540 [Photobacterium jeanii]
MSLNSVTRPVILDALSRQQLEKQCQNRMNWSDGGRWIGQGKAPNCAVKERHSRTLSHTYSFPTDELATKWNLEWEKRIRHMGHMGTAALTTGLTLMTGGMVGITVGTIAAIVKDELQAGMGYPRMARGSSYEVIFKYEFQWSPYPSQAFLLLTIETLGKNHQGDITYQTSGTRKYMLKDLPDGLGRRLAMAPSQKTQSEFK